MIQTPTVPLASICNNQGGLIGEMLNFHGLHHVGLLCENLEISLKFYCGILGNHHPFIVNA